MAHGACRLGQDLQQAPIGTVARPGLVSAFAHGLAMHQFARDVIVIGPFVDEPP